MVKHQGGWLRLFRHIVTFPQRIKRLEAQVEDLRDTLAIRQESIEWQADVISEMKFQKASLKRELMQVQDENRHLRDEWHEARSKIKSMDEEIRQLKAEISPLAPPADLTNYETIRMGELHQLLKAQLLTEDAAHPTNIYLLDHPYKLFPKEDIRRFLDWSKVDGLKHVEHFFDCEDSSRRLLGEISIPGWAQSAFGKAFTAYHVFNVFVDADKELYIIEPQTDQMWKLEEIKHNLLYFPMWVVII